MGPAAASPTEILARRNWSLPGGAVNGRTWQGAAARPAAGDARSRLIAEVHQRRLCGGAVLGSDSRPDAGRRCLRPGANLPSDGNMQLSWVSVRRRRRCNKLPDFQANLILDEHPGNGGKTAVHQALRSAYLSDVMQHLPVLGRSACLPTTR